MNDQLAPLPRRIPAIDALRGCALLGMFVFHLTWDLAYYGYIPSGAPFSPAMMGFGHAVAIAFLALAGASLALAARNGMNWALYWRRLAMISAAAGVITLGTLYLFPDEFIFFGILHCIAVASLLAALFLRAPPWAPLIAALLVASAPLFIASPALDNLFGWSLGLGAHWPRTNDWRPLFPWAGATLAGLGLMQIALAHRLPAAIVSWRAMHAPTRAIVWGGRHSLLVYLVHQPLFFGLITLAAMAAPPAAAPAVDEDAQFQQSCVDACRSSGATVNICTALCACVAEGTHASGLWRAMLDQRMTPAQKRSVDALTQECAAPKPRQ